MRILKKLALSSILLLTIQHAQASTNLVNNGSFEQTSGSPVQSPIFTDPGASYSYKSGGVVHLAPGAQLLPSCGAGCGFYGADVGWGLEAVMYFRALGS